MAILCTEDDNTFEDFKKQVTNNKIIFHIKDIFKEHWITFLNKFPNFKIRETVFENIKRMFKCKTLELRFDVFTCPDCGEEKIVMHTCKSR